MTLQYKDSRLQRMGAILLRFYYLYKNSWPRLIEMSYWPVFQIITWGFLTLHLSAGNSTWVEQAFGVLLAGALLWEVLMRSQIGYALSFLEEMWSKNLGHLFVSPLRFYEWIGALSILTFIRTFVGIFPAMLIALFLYHYSIFDMGVPLVFFYSSLVFTGIWMSLIAQAIILRYGLGAESFAWMIAFAISPISCVFYPLEVLPTWLQPFALALPTTYCFEGMRDILVDNYVNWKDIGLSYALNLVYFSLCILYLNYTFKKIRETGNLLQYGE